MTTKPIRCLVPGCTNAPSVRGLCVCCYKCARKLVADGKITWEILERRRKCLPVVVQELSFRRKFFLSK